MSVLAWGLLVETWNLGDGHIQFLHVYVLCANHFKGTYHGLVSIQPYIYVFFLVNDAEMNTAVYVLFRAAVTFVVYTTKMFDFQIYDFIYKKQSFY